MSVSPMRNQRFLILGTGSSGRAAAALLTRHGRQVLALDESACSAPAGSAHPDSGYLAGVLRSFNPECCVVSPGFHWEHPWLELLRREGISTISELALGAACWPNRILAITGSKGKSSLAKLCADTLNLAGISAAPCGNYGLPLSQLALAEPLPLWAVLEVSSFQLELTDHLVPQIAILLNLQPDHLDRHRTMERYAALKLKLFDHAPPHGLKLWPAGLELPPGLQAPAGSTTFGATTCPWHYAPERHAIVTPSLALDLRGSYFDNHVLGAAAAAATAALQWIGLDAAQISRGLKQFRPLPHRMEVVAADSRGITYINDSKATTLSAVAAALAMTQKPVRLIAGGILKEEVTPNLKELLTTTTQKVYLIGQCAAELFQAWHESVPCVICDTLPRAFALASDEAQPGEVVLLSPGTASFDQFTSFQQRGEVFCQLVRRVADLERSAVAEKQKGEIEDEAPDKTFD